MRILESPPTRTSPLALLRAFALPGGDAIARSVREVRTTQRGRLRASADARWVAFTATETIDATRSRFVWEARMGDVVVVDAYEEGHGRLELKHLGRRDGDQRMAGPDVDRGELQRYLAVIAFGCAAAFVSNASLLCVAVDPLTLRLRDDRDATGAAVDLRIGDDGRPLFVSATRPRTIGRAVVNTPWEACGADFREHDGLRIAHGVSASWLPSGEARFTYIETELTAVDVVKT